MPVEPQRTPGAPEAVGHYSAAVRAGDWVVLAGQLGIDPASGELADGLEAQARQVLANIAAILADCGGSLADIAKTTVFLGVTIDEFAVVNAIYAEAFGAHKPARTLIEVAALPRHALIEIEAWAYLPAGNR